MSTRMRRRALAAIVLSLVSVGVVACGALAGINDYVIGDCKGGTCGVDGGSDAVVDNHDSAALPADDSGVPCLGRDPKGVRVGSPGNTFCIDSTEVTFGQYSDFLAAGVDPSSQPPKCAWNESFAPQVVVPDGGSPPPGTYPVFGVDWCDALAYCTWAGKYLCGQVDKGKKVGPITPESAFDYHSHQWLLACTAEARLRYPYGNVFDPTRCNLGDYDAGKPVDVASATGCVGGYSGIHDMIGNVWEWYDGTCTPEQVDVDAGRDGGPAHDACPIRGGSYADRGAAQDCTREGAIPRDLQLPNVGFRCCSD